MCALQCIVSCKLANDITMSKGKCLSTYGNFNIINHLETGEKQSDLANYSELSLSKYTVVGIDHIIPRS